MTTKKHTPAPWEDNPRAGNITGPNGEIICEYVDRIGGPLIGASKRYGGEERMEANARLIAAAPDLLEAARAFEGLTAFAKPSEWQAAKKLAREAIAKAEGGE